MGGGGRGGEHTGTGRVRHPVGSSSPTRPAAGACLLVSCPPTPPLTAIRKDVAGLRGAPAKQDLRRGQGGAQPGGQPRSWAAVQPAAVSPRPRTCLHRGQACSPDRPRPAASSGRGSRAARPARASGAAQSNVPTPEMVRWVRGMNREKPTSPGGGVGARGDMGRDRVERGAGRPGTRGRVGEGATECRRRRQQQQQQQQQQQRRSHRSWRPRCRTAARCGAAQAGGARRERGWEARGRESSGHLRQQRRWWSQHSAREFTCPPVPHRPTLRSRCSTRQWCRSAAAGAAGERGSRRRSGATGLDAAGLPAQPTRRPPARRGAAQRTHGAALTGQARGNVRGHPAPAVVPCTAGRAGEGAGCCEQRCLTCPSGPPRSPVARCWPERAHSRRGGRR